MPAKTSADQLLKAASKVFHQRGYHAAKVSEITREAGVAQGTFYLYFQSKRQAFVELMEGFAGKISGAALGLDWESIHKGEDLRQQLVDLYTSIFQICADNRDVADLFFNAATSADERAAAIREEFMGGVEGISAQSLVDGAERGYFRAFKTETISRAIVGMFLNIVLRTIIAEGRTFRLRELAEDLVDFELRGLFVTEGGAAK